MKRVRRLICGAGALILALGGGYVLLLRYPQALFAYSVTSGPLSLYSDRAFALEHGRSLLDRVHAKLARSPLYSSQERHTVFICNAPWRQRLFFLAAPGAGASTTTR
jgi:hypothetical protein